MAKSNKRTTMNGGCKVVAVVLALVIVAAILIAGFGSSWFTNGDILTWFNGWGLNAPADEDGESGISAMSFGIPVEEYEEYGVSPQAIQARSIVATFDPPNTSDQRVTFDFAWEDPASEWARGKEISDYIGYTAAENYAPRCSVWALKEYGETIICTVTSLSKSSLKDTVRLEYVARFVHNGGVKFRLDDHYPDRGAIDFGAMLADPSNFGTGSVIPTDFTITNLTFNLTPEWGLALHFEEYLSVPVSYVRGNFLEFSDLFLLLDLDYGSYESDWSYIISCYNGGLSEYPIFDDIEVEFNAYYNGELVFECIYMDYIMNITQELVSFHSVPANSLSASKDIYF